MLFGIPKVFPDYSILSQEVKNALIESFVLHLRCLLFFLYPDQIKEDDVVATDYIADGDTHEKWRRENISPVLAKALERVNKEAAHLTTRRITGFTSEKAWDFQELLGEFKTVLVEFCDEADPTKLHGEVIQLVRKL
jgi:hypothetical protein